MFKKFKNEIDYFNKQTHNFKILVLTNLIYAFVLPVIEIFVAAYIMRNSNDPVKVVIYQLTIYTGIPFTFWLNGYLLKKIPIRSLYVTGMLLSGISMVIMMSLKVLDIYGIAIAGLTMGMSFGFYWANRDYLALETTQDSNRNYYYGLETFFYTIIAVVVPISIGWFIEAKGKNWGVQNVYKIITCIVFLITIIASTVCVKGKFKNPVSKPFFFLKFQKLWYKLLSLSFLKGMTQGFIVTAPAMLTMRMLGKEGALGTAQSIGAIIAAVVMYVLGRVTKPNDRLKVFTVGIILFVIGTCVNGILFNAAGVVIFILLLLIARPLLDLAYFPIQFRVIDIVSKIENRVEFAYILNHEFGLYSGRFLGIGSFIVFAYAFSSQFALRYAILLIALFQIFSYFVAKNIIKHFNLLEV